LGVGIGCIPDVSTVEAEQEWRILCFLHMYSQERVCFSDRYRVNLYSLSIRAESIVLENLTIMLVLILHLCLSTQQLYREEHLNLDFLGGMGEDIYF
jgi:hypothetical protein